MKCIPGGSGLVPAALLSIAVFAGPPVHDAEASARIDPRLHSLRDRQEETREARLEPEAAKTSLSRLFPAVGVLSDRSGLTVDCLMELDPDGESSLRTHGLVPRTRVGNIVTITVPVDAIDLLETLPGIRTVEMSRPLKPSLDVSSVATFADMAHGSSTPPFPPTGFTGRDVVVGVIDTGIDLQHGDFRDDANMTRLDFVWDQTVNGTFPTGFDYGTEWTAAQINAGTATETDIDGHGTHVTGIAAGDGSDTGNGQPANQFIGVAPEADIIFVKTTFLTADVTDAVSYIFSKANGRPAVVNLSLGTQDGPHDGTSLFDRTLSDLAGAGRIIVAAAGNESNPTNSPSAPNIHARHVFEAAADSMVFTFTVPVYTPNPGSNPLNDFVVLDGWYESTDNFSFRVESPTGRRTGEVTNGNSLTTCINGNQEGRVYIENNDPDPNPFPFNGDNEIYIEITEATSGFACGFPESGTWKIIAYKKAPIVNGTLDFWISAAIFNSGSAPSFVQGAANSHLVGSPASALNVISVGAYITKRQWVSLAGARQYIGLTDADIGKIASFSSPGPLRDGTLAPDISAPGQGIASSRSAAEGFPNASFNLLDGKHVINQGTSQACPHVTGAVALLLEKYPTETPDQIRNRLVSTARHDAFTGMDPNNTFGHGKMDVMGALDFGVPIYLSVLEAAPVDGGVRLHWAVEGDDPFLGFHIARGESENGPFERLTASLLTGGPDFEFTDVNVTPGTDYWYRIDSVDLEGRIESFGPLLARAGAPRLTLLQNGPNPFAASTTIGFSLPEAGPVSLKVFDLSGKLVRTLQDLNLPAGRSEVVWDGADDGGLSAPNGVYFYRLSTRTGSETRKMILKRP